MNTLYYALPYYLKFKEELKNLKEHPKICYTSNCIMNAI